MRDLTREIPVAALRRFALAGLATLVAGCFADPMPTPERNDLPAAMAPKGPLSEFILVSATQAQRSQGPIDLIGVIGLKGAAPGDGFIEVTNVSSSIEVTVPSGKDGTFAAVVSGVAGDTLRLVFRESKTGLESDSIDLGVVLYDEKRAPAAPNTNDAVAGGTETFARAAASPPAAAAPSNHGVSTITGTKLTAGHKVAVGNTRTGIVLEATVDAEGGFTVVLEAAAADTILVIVRDPSGLASEVATLTVPAP